MLSLTAGAPPIAAKRTTHVQFIVAIVVRLIVAIVVRLIVAIIVRLIVAIIVRPMPSASAAVPNPWIGCGRFSTENSLRNSDRPALESLCVFRGHY